MTCSESEPSAAAGCSPPRNQRRVAAAAAGAGRSLPTMRKPRLRHPGLSLVRRGAGSAIPSSALRHGRLLRSWSPLALPMHLDLASASGARCAHSTSLWRPCQVARSSDFASAWLTGFPQCYAPFGGCPIWGIAKKSSYLDTSVPMTTRAARGNTDARASERGTPRKERIGERLRQLRVSAGLTQTDLAGDRFSKEYISQIERGKTRPTTETIGWLASRLGVDATFLASGVSSDQRARTEAILTRAAAEADRRDLAAAVEEYTEARNAIVSAGAVELQVRALTGEAWARAHLGEVRPAIHLLEEARALAEGPQFTDMDRAEVLFRLGVARYLISSIATSVALLGEALTLVERSPLPSDVLRANILTWRSRCYRRQRDFEAAREDVERALELAEAMQDTKALGEAYFQASLIAERDGHWVLARTYAEKAKAQSEELTDRTHIA